MRKVLGNRYELRTLLAAGGMGQVWSAEDQLLGRPVAVKVLRSEFTGDEVFLARFRAEAQHAAALSHPNIAAVYDYGEEPVGDTSDEHLAYLVMELVEGESLSVQLARVGRLDADRTVDVLRQTAAALAAAHEAGVVHRDVKPGNVLVRRDGVIKITDFGIAWSAGSVPLTKTGQVVGTASYLSPEQAAGAHATAASDVYSLGMVGYECLTGHRAFDGDNSVTIALRHLRDQPEPLPEDLPVAVRTLIERAIVKDPAQRYPDGAAVVAAVDEVLAGRQLPPVQRTDTQSFWLLPDAGASAVSASAVAPARSGRMGKVLVPLLALLVGAGLAAGVLQTVAPGGETAATAASVDLGPVAPVEQTTGPVQIDPADYLDRPLAAVQAQLEGLGLVVQTEEIPTTSEDPGTVVDVAPLADGTTVVVSYAVAPPTVAAPSSAAPRRSAEQAVQRPTPTREAAPTSTESTRAPVTSAPRTTTPAPGTTSAPATTTSAPAEETTPAATTPSAEPEPTKTSTAPTTGGGTVAPTPSPTTPAPTTDEPGTGSGNGNGQGNGNGNGEGKKDKGGEISAQG
ncbi:serine/threonine protein kinase [Modestobacter sp. L9-4]|uniref:serine/threonine protein kinase n=1 Tax=Modestobacter sp. L9-4 TaxID=2851567 RepID=UPI001EFFA84C|nr:serine/threonine protein kinase [Modestobacter sp. L9-4]